MGEQGGRDGGPGEEAPRLLPLEEQPLFNEAQLLHLLRVEFSRARRYRFPLAILLLAVDRLEERTDLLAAGSRRALLGELAGRLRGDLRLSDFLGLHGGEQLLAVLPHTDGEGARRLARRLAGRVEGRPFSPAGREVEVTCSIGIAATSTRERLFHESLLGQAERALLLAQERGGHRIEAEP